MAKSKITAEQARALFHYNPETGQLWKRLEKQSKLCDTPHICGYVQVYANGRTYLAHRLVWLWVHGEWPERDIDHLNAVRTDNRLANLRAVNRSVNMQNLRQARSDNASGLLGVTRVKHVHKKPWVAQIRINGTKNRFIGYYATPEEAHEAYLEAKRQHHEGCTI